MSAKKGDDDKKTPERVTPKKRSLRDAPKGPSLREIEKSIQEGTKQSLGTFRRMIGW